MLDHRPLSAYFCTPVKSLGKEEVGMGLSMCVLVPITDESHGTQTGPSTCCLVQRDFSMAGMDLKYID